MSEPPNNNTANVSSSTSPRSAIARYTKNQKQSEPSLVIDVADVSFDCSGPPDGVEFVSIIIKGESVQPGSYSIAPAPAKASAAYLESAGGSAVHSYQGIETGSVTIAKSFASTDDPGSVEGSYEVVIDGRRVSGTFDAQGCASSLHEIIP